MSLEEFEQLETRKGPLCWHATISNSLEAKDIAKLNEALQHATLQTRAIWRWLSQRNIAVASTSIARHRRKECGCFR
jgi:hypothetical protein